MRSATEPRQTSKPHLRLKPIRKNPTPHKLTRRIRRTQILLGYLGIRPTQISKVDEITCSIADNRDLLNDAVVECVKATGDLDAVFVQEVNAVDFICCFEDRGGKTGFDVPLDVAVN